MLTKSRVMEQVWSERMLAGFDDITAQQVTPKESVCAASSMLSDQRRCQTEQNSNQFWRLLGTVLGEHGLHELAYDARLERVQVHGIGIRDVLAACRREGSLDSAIRNAEPNDFGSLREHAPLLKRVCFNGKTAGRFADVIGKAGYETLVLPSSSPAKAMLSFEQKLVQWREICLRQRRACEVDDLTWCLLYCNWRSCGIRTMMRCAVQDQH